MVMNEKTVVITEKDGVYQIQNNGISDFALLGILECIVFDLKSVNRQDSGGRQRELPAEQNNIILESSEAIPKSETVEQEEAVEQKPKREVAQESPTPDIRTRISNAVKAIRALGGRIEDTDLSDLTDEELQSELVELTSQYKRLKSSKASK